MKPDPNYEQVPGTRTKGIGKCNKSNLPAGMSRKVAEKESTYIVFMQHSDFINFDIYKLMIYVQNESLDVTVYVIFTIYKIFCMIVY